MNSLIKSETNYLNDKIDGLLITYFEDGSLESKESYTSGISNNDLVLYDRKGNVIYTKKEPVGTSYKLCYHDIFF